MAVLLKTLWLLVKPMLDTIFIKNVLKTFATSSSFLTISSRIHLKKIFSSDFNLIENRAFTVAEDFLLLLMSFHKTDTNIPLFIVLSSCR